MTIRERKLLDSLMQTPKKDWIKLTKYAPWHGLAYKLEKNGYSICISYSTPIAMKTPCGQVMRLWDGYSKTSMGHLSTWCMDVRLPFINGEMWRKMIVGRKYGEYAIEKLR